MLENWAKLTGFAAILSAALCVSFLWALNYVPPQNTEWTCEAKRDADDPNNTTLKAFSCHTKQAEKLQNQANGTQANRAENLLENVKITDVLLALFTGLLVVVGGFQAYWLWGTVEATATVATAGKESADAAIATERAYVFPGYDPITFDDQGHATIPLVMTNVGKTPAVIKEVGFAFLNRADLPASPEQADWQWLIIPYDWAITPHARKSIRVVTSPLASDNVFTCYIRYTEIFIPKKTPHLVRMSMLIRPQLADDRISHVGGNTWNDWD